MEKQIENLFTNWLGRNFQGIFAKTRDQVHQKLLDLIPVTSSIGFSGSQTLEELEIIEMLETRGNKVFNQYRTDLSRDESMLARKMGAQADFFLTSANAIAETGELVFFSAYGHRIAGIADAKNLIVISGINKLVYTLDDALKRARDYVGPLNCKRLKWDTPCAKEGICRNEICLYPAFTRMCCQTLVLEADMNPERVKIMIVNENLGY